MPSMFTLRSPVARRLGLAGAVAFAAQAVGGCYARRPVDSGAVAPGASVVVAISDRGRVSLNGALGEAPEAVEGRLTARTDSTLTLAVTEVESLRGGSTRWTGDPVTLRLADVAYVQTKRFDRGRSAVVAVAGLAAVAALVAGISLVVGGGGNGDGPPGGGAGGGGGEASKSPAPRP